MAENIDDLRARAEEYLRHSPRTASTDEEKLKVSQLIHELSVYQVELEMQNNQLKLVQDELLSSNVSFYKLYNEAPVGYVIIDAQNQVVKTNQTFLRYINAALHQVLNSRLEECFEGDNRLQIMAWMRSERVRVQEIELEVTTGEGTRYLQVSSANIDSWNGQACKFLVFTDTTELVMAKRNSALSVAAINAASEGCFVVDSNQRIIFVNPALLRIFGYQQEEVIGRHPRIFQSVKTDDDFTKQIWLEVSRGNEWQQEIWMRDKQQREFACLMKVSPISEEHDSRYSYVAIVSDITERKRYQDTIIRQATEDALTGLPNRALLMDRLKLLTTQAQRNETYCIVMFMDLDGFKDINDTRGHNIGDELLVQVAKRLKLIIRESDTLARMGGDEFVFVLSDMHPDDIEAISRKILDSIRESFDVEGQQHSITASLGVSIYPEHSMDVNELLRLADQSMYIAKRLGKNQFAIAEPEHQDS